MSLPRKLAPRQLGSAIAGGLEALPGLSGRCGGTGGRKRPPRLCVVLAAGAKRACPRKTRGSATLLTTAMAVPGEDQRQGPGCELGKGAGGLGWGALGYGVSPTET